MNGNDVRDNGALKQSARRPRWGRCASLIGLLWAALAAAGCNSPPPESSRNFLIRAGAHSVSARDYQEALELYKVAYPESPGPGAAEPKEIRLRLLDDLASELVILNRSDELKLSVSDAELEFAVESVRRDYPPGAFEQTLLEAAISFDAWKKRLRTRLLVEKTMEVDLKDQPPITAEEVAAYYKQHYLGLAGAAKSDQELRKLEESIVADLKQKKVEDAYGAWVGLLRNKYPVEINQALWERLSRLKPAGPSAAPPAQSEKTES
jgi:hypothetical protein